MRRRSGRGLTALAVMGLACALAVGADKPPPSENEAKASLILTFLDFVEWPKDTFARGDSPLVIGILGQDPFGELLERTFRGQKPQGHPIQIKRSGQVKDLRDCNVVFVCHSESSNVSSIVSELADKPVLTIGEVAGFCKRGGILNFSIEDQKVGFEANPKAAERSSLHLSAELLKRARVLESSQGKAP